MKVDNITKDVILKTVMTMDTNKNDLLKFHKKSFLNQILGFPKLIRPEKNPTKLLELIRFF